MGRIAGLCKRRFDIFPVVLACVFSWGCAHVSPVELRRPGAAAARPPCDLRAAERMLSPEPQEKLGWLSRWLGFLTTPFKRLGISGWVDTGCNAHGTGIAVRDAQESTYFRTIDVALESFFIEGERAEADGRYMRIEVAPGTLAHRLLRHWKIRAGDRLEFGGFLLIDRDGPHLEVHPDRNLEPVD